MLTHENKRTHFGFVHYRGADDDEFQWPTDTAAVADAIEQTSDDGGVAEIGCEISDRALANQSAMSDRMKSSVLAAHTHTHEHYFFEWYSLENSMGKIEREREKKSLITICISRWSVSSLIGRWRICEGSLISLITRLATTPLTRKDARRRRRFKGRSVFQSGTENDPLDTTFRRDLPRWVA